MSMSEFSGQPSGTENDLSSFPCKAKGLPDDFSEEDMTFAQELGSLLSLQDEEIPPYFAQTLLEPDDPRFQVVEQGFEQKTCAHVFRRLKLRRRLFRSSASSFHSRIPSFPVRQPLTAVFAACLLFMLITVIATENSFAAGMAILWPGAHIGVLQMPGYPKGITSTASRPQATQDTSDPQMNQMSLLSVQQQLTFSMYWPETLPDNYSLTGASLYNGPNQGWADGPVVEFSYDYLLPGVKPHGSGRIAIREFKPMGKVLQVVQYGAAHQIEINNGGEGQVAVYIDGQWGQTTKVSQAWVFGTRSELLYEHNGIVFWIVGDQRDSINGGVLQDIASSMFPFNMNRAMRNHADMLVPYGNSTWLFSGDVFYLNSPDGTSWSVVAQPGASSQPPKLSVRGNSPLDP